VNTAAGKVEGFLSIKYKFYLTGRKKNQFCNLFLSCISYLTPSLNIASENPSRVIFYFK